MLPDQSEIEAPSSANELSSDFVPEYWQNWRTVLFELDHSDMDRPIDVSSLCDEPVMYEFDFGFTAILTVPSAVADVELCPSSKRVECRSSCNVLFSSLESLSCSA